MKNTRRTVALFLAVILALALFAGCGKASPEGKYYVKSVDGKPIEDLLKEQSKEMGIDLEEYFKQAGIKSAGEILTYEFKSDGTAVGSSGGVVQNTGKWTQDGDKITFTTDSDSTVEFTLKGKELRYYEKEFGEWIFIKK